MAKIAQMSFNIALAMDFVNFFPSSITLINCILGEYFGLRYFEVIFSFFLPRHKKIAVTRQV